MSKSYLVLGAAGFIGRNLVDALVANQNVVHVFDRIDTSNIFPSTKVKHVGFHVFSSEDILDYIRENDVDVVVHLISGLLPASNVDEYFKELDSVVLPTMQLVDGLKNNGVQFVYFSSGGTVYGNAVEHEINEDHKCSPINYYGYSKHQIESFITTTACQSKLKYLILRPSNPYGRYQNINGKQGFIAVSIGRILRKESIEIWGDGSVVRDYIYIGDLCSVFMRLMDLDIGNTILNIGSGEGYSLTYIVKSILDCVKEKHEHLVNYKPSRNIDVSRVVLDISKLKDLIEFQSTPISEGIKMFIEHVVLTNNMD